MPSLPGTGPKDYLASDDFDALDLDGDLLDDDIDEISKFTEQTAITDVSNLARGMSGPSPVEDLDEDISADLLDEIMESTPLEPLPAPPPSASGGFSRPPQAPFSPQAQAQAQAQALPTAVGMSPLSSLLESDTQTDVRRPRVGAAPNRRTVPMVVIGGLVIAAVVFTAYGLFSGGDEETPAETETAAVASGAQEKPATDTTPSEGAKAEKSQKTSKSSKPEEKAETAAAAEIKEGTLPPHTCKPLSAYPKFAWRDILETLARAADKSSICGLFGMTKEDAVTAMRGTPNFGPTGYDLLPRSTVFEVFPDGKAERRAPSIEMLFIDDLLYEIRMNFRMAHGDTLDPNMFKAALKAPKTITGDPLNREIKTYTDGDMIIFWYKKTDAFKRVFNEVVFSSRIVRKGLEKELKARSEAQIQYEQGVALYNQKQVMRAIDKFRKAVKIVPGMGSAYIFEGIALLQTEQFDKIESVAAKAFENSIDDRARAGAKGLQAVVALYNGDKETALALFKNASGLDPTDPEFATSVDELKTGNYDAARVAKTAARMDCRRNHPDWSVKGLLARGNFPDNATFQKAKKDAKRKSNYKSAYEMWDGWECR